MDQCTHYKSPIRRREKGADNLFEAVIAENFLILGKETDIQVQEAERITNEINPKRSMPRHIVIKMSKIREKQQEKSNYLYPMEIP